MRHGFKAQMKRLAMEIRSEFGLTKDDRIDPHAIADAYGYEVVNLSDLECAKAVEHFSEEESTRFSGAVIPVLTGAAIVVNDRHTPERQASTVAHEFAHIELAHPYGESLLSPDGCRFHDATVEAEATFLAGELLFPADAARYHAIRGTNPERVAAIYGISLEMARWRMNISGGRKIRARMR